MAKEKTLTYNEGQIQGMRFAAKTVLEKAVDYFCQPTGGQMQTYEVATLLKDLAHKLSRIADATERDILRNQEGKAGK